MASTPCRSPRCRPGRCSTPGKATERDFAEVVARNRRDAKDNPYAQVAGDFDVDVLLEEPYVVAPLRAHDCPPITDGAAAVVLAAGDKARELVRATRRGSAASTTASSRTSPGMRDLTRRRRPRWRREKAGVGDGPLDVAELSSPFSHQELILREALGLGADVDVNPSGGALAANP